MSLSPVTNGQLREIGITQNLFYWKLLTGFCQCSIASVSNEPENKRLEKREVLLIK